MGDASKLYHICIFDEYFFDCISITLKITDMGILNSISQNCHRNATNLSLLKGYKNTSTIR